ncbi:MAG: DUF3119 family protein [Cyanobacteriota bacterium]|nr:DUF3119 family protein [Cyanobacteria bacterium K_Offshore_surface_m2_239]MEB3156083.1 DUF3119 family protein [Cyanobacteriota bacterium]
MAIPPSADADGGTSASSPATAGTEEVTLAPRYWVPLGLVLIAGVVLTLSPRWPVFFYAALSLLTLAGFLALQTNLLRLCFQAEALVVQRSGEEIRRFPYDAWLAWRVFFPAVPVLFYFREQNSPHLLPMLFDAEALRAELERRVPLPVAPRP